MIRGNPNNESEIIKLKAREIGKVKMPRESSIRFLNRGT